MIKTNTASRLTVPGNHALIYPMARRFQSGAHVFLAGALEVLGLTILGLRFAPPQERLTKLFKAREAADSRIIIIDVL